MALPPLVREHSLRHYDDVAETHLTPVAAHRAFVLADLVQTPVVDAPIDGALGLALARRVRAKFPLPPFTNSAMDGYAVRAADVAQAPIVLPVRGDIPAGFSQDLPLAGGTAHRIMTGAPLPSGSDAVVRVEWTDGGTDEVRIDRSVPAGAEVRHRGGDVEAGDEIGRPGESIGAADIALFASLGMTEVATYRPPRVAVVSTGDELTPVGQVLPPGAIYDSNSHLMAALVRASGGQVAACVQLTDDVTQAGAVLGELAKNCDLIVTMGGISAGAYEVIKEVFAALGGVTFTSVAVQPGKPQGFGFLDGTPLIALPGNPVSSLVSFELFVRPAMRKIGGFSCLDRPHLTARTAGEIKASADRVRYVPAHLDSSCAVVTPPSRHGSHLIAKAAGANCLIEVPAGADVIAADSQVAVLLIGGETGPVALEP